MLCNCKYCFDIEQRMLINYTTVPFLFKYKRTNNKQSVYLLILTLVLSVHMQWFWMNFQHNISLTRNTCLSVSVLPATFYLRLATRMEVIQQTVWYTLCRHSQWVTAAKHETSGLVTKTVHDTQEKSMSDRLSVPRTFFARIVLQRY